LQDPVVSQELRGRAPRPSPEGPTRIANEGLIESSQAVLREVLERTLARDDIWSLLNREAAIHYAHLTKDAFRSTIDAGALGQVVSGISWVLDQPALMGITETMSAAD